MARLSISGTLPSLWLQPCACGRKRITGSSIPRAQPLISVDLVDSTELCDGGCVDIYSTTETVA